MKQTLLIGLALVFLITTVTFISPLLAQQQSADSYQMRCFVGESSNAACSGKWIYFAGNTSGVDSGAWVVRMNGEKGETWYKNGKKFVLLSEPD